MPLLRQIIRLIAFIVFTIFCVAAQFLWALFPVKDRYKFARLWHRGGVAIVGIKVRTEGLSTEGRVIFLSNHVSHLDISVIGGLMPARFISKQEVRDWPVFGLLARLQDTIFVDRAPKLSAIKQSRALIQKALSQGERLIIFPEGTNTIGDTILPFRRGMLDGLEAANYKLQPVAIQCTAVDGKALQTQADYEVYGWGDISFALHFWRAMGHKSIDVLVSFLPPYDVGDKNVIEGLTIEKAGDDVRQRVEYGH